MLYICKSNYTVILFKSIRGSGRIIKMRFGELHYRRGVITYSISPYEVNAFKGFVSQGFPNFVRRFREKFFVVASRKQVFFI